MATRKITELPLINTISGSYSVVPIVIGNTVGTGNTDQISIENFSKFVNAYSAHTGSAGNTFTGPQTINNNVTITGNEVVNGNVTISGRLTVTEIVAQYETASILFSTGSTKLGDQITDKHEFTGSTNITGSLNYNGVLVANIDINTINRLQQTTQSLQVATASLNAFTASQDSRNYVISQFTSSTNAHIVGISDFTSSQLAVNLANSIYTASVDSHIVGISTYTSSVRDTLARVHQATQSLQVATASLNRFTASQDDRNFVISQFTSSTNAHIVGIATFTSSQYDTMARVYQTTSSLQSTTASLNQFTASQDSRNFTLSQVTGSLIGITNGLMAFTAALDSTYATDAQLYQLYQATRSIELTTGSLIGVTNGLMAYTASNSTLNTGLRGEVDGIEAYTASLKAAAIVSSSTQVRNYDVFALNSNLYTSTGSLIGITNGLMAFTASLDNTYATDAQLYQLYAETASIKAEIGGIELYTSSLKGAAIVSSSTQVQNYDVFALNSNLYNGTGSIKGEIAGIEAYTASLKGAAIVSSSQQVQNYFTFAKTGSANTFYGTNTFSGSILVSGSLIPSVGIGQYTSSFGLGSNTNSWKDIWVASTGNINFLNNSGVVESTISSTANGLSALSLLVGTSSFCGSPVAKMYIGQGRTNNPNNIGIGGGGVLESVEWDTGNFNIAIGQSCLYLLTNGQANTAIGHNALRNCRGNYNTGVGYMAGDGLVAGSGNVFVGYNAGRQLENASGNVGIGDGALMGYNDNGFFAANVAIGSDAGYYLSGSSHNNIILGDRTGPQGSYKEENYKLYIGDGATPLLTGNLEAGNLSLTIKGALTVDANSSNTIHQITGSVNITGSNTLIGTKTISGSVFITGSKTIVGTNTVIGTSTFSGSVYMSGSVYGNVTAQPVASNTSSIDISTANFFTITLGSGTGTSGLTTHISASNMRPGQSVNVLVTTGTNSTASFSTNVRQPSGSLYLPTSGSGNKDILSFVSFDSSNLYLVAVNQMI